MDSYQTEDQQVEAIINFWKKHKKLIISSVFGIFLLFSAVNYYYHHQENKAKKASLMYSEVLNLIKNKEYQKAKTQSEILITKYSKTVYNDNIYLSLAKIYIEENDKSTAIEYLNKLIKKSPKSAYVDLARVRLARILDSQDKYQEALEVLKHKPINETFIALYEETKGDIYSAMNEIDKAKHTYQIAKNNLPEDIKSPWLELKLIDLGEGEV